MKKPSKSSVRYRVKFQEKGDKEPTTVIVEKFYPSDFLGLVTLEGFIFKEESSLVVLPGEDETRKRFENTDKLHIPYHVLLSIEEYREDLDEGEAVPFLKDVSHSDDTPRSPD